MSTTGESERLLSGHESKPFDDLYGAHARQSPRHTGLDWRARAMSVASLISFLGAVCLFVSVTPSLRRPGGVLFGDGAPRSEHPVSVELEKPKKTTGEDVVLGASRAGITLATLTCPASVCGEAKVAVSRSTLAQWCGIASITSILVHVDKPEFFDEYLSSCPNKIKRFPGNGCSTDEGGVRMKCFFDSLLAYSEQYPAEAFAFANVDVEIEGLDKAFAYVRELRVGPYLGLIRRAGHAGYAIDFFLTNQLISPFGEGEDDFFAGKPMWDNRLVSSYWRAGHLGLDLANPDVRLVHKDESRNPGRDDPVYRARIIEKYGAANYLGGGVHTADAVIDCSKPRCMLLQKDHVDIIGGAMEEATPVINAMVIRAALRAQGNADFVMTVTLTEGYVKMFANLLCAARRTGTNNIMVLALDLSAYDYAMENDVPVVYAVPPAWVPPESYSRSSLGFTRLMLYKLKMLEQIVSAGISVVSMDSDVLPMSNSFSSVLSSYVNQYELFGQRVDVGLIGGLVGIKGSKTGRMILQGVVKCQNDRLKELISSSRDGKTYDPKLYATHNAQRCMQAQFGALDPSKRAIMSQIMDGRAYFEERKPFDYDADIALHHDYDSPLSAKIRRMHEAKLWLLDEELSCPSAGLGLGFGNVMPTDWTPQKGTKTKRLGSSPSPTPSSGTTTSNLRAVVKRATMLTFYVLTSGRTAELQQTLNSILTIEFPLSALNAGKQFDVEIRIDKATSPAAVSQAVQAADNLRSQYTAGQVRVVRGAHMGLTAAWVNIPSWQSEWFIVLEDDITVSSQVLMPLLQYGETMKSDDRIFGFTNQYQKQVLGFKPASAPSLPCDTPVAYQLMSTWGPLIKSEQWRMFRNWMFNLDVLDHPVVGDNNEKNILRKACTPGLQSNLYIKDLKGADLLNNVWSEWIQRYLVDHGKALIHHQLCNYGGGGKAGFVVHRAADGIHFHSVDANHPAGHFSSALVTTPPTLKPLEPGRFPYYDIFLRPSNPQSLDQLSEQIQNERRKAADPCIYIPAPGLVG